MMLCHFSFFREFQNPFVMMGPPSDAMQWSKKDIAVVEDEISLFPEKYIF